jgi:hypothetical protein
LDEVRVLLTQGLCQLVMGYLQVSQLVVTIRHQRVIEISVAIALDRTGHGTQDTQ